MKHEYHEGPKAGENFERLARAAFQAPKVANPRPIVEREYLLRNLAVNTEGFHSNVGGAQRSPQQTSELLDS